MDGNERLGWLACVVLLDLNEHETGLDDEGAFSLVMAVAAGEVDLAATARALELRRRP